MEIVLRIFLRYLFLWLFILLGLCIIAIIMHWSELVAMCSNIFWGYIMGVGICALIICAIFYMIRAVR